MRARIKKGGESKKLQLISKSINYLLRFFSSNRMSMIPVGMFVSRR